jgi:hypothetical protein
MNWPRPSLRFSLRTGLILFLLIGAGLGFVSRWVHEIKVRGDAQLRTLSRRGRSWRVDQAHVQASYSKAEVDSQFTDLVRKWVHPEYQRKYDGAYITGRHLADMDLARDLGKSFGLAELDLQADSISSEFAKAVFSVKGLERVGLRVGWDNAQHSSLLLELRHACSLRELSTNSFLSEEIAAELAQLPMLETVSVYSCSPEAIASLAKAKLLKSLHVRSIRHSESDFRGIAENAALFNERSRKAIKSAMDQLAGNSQFESLRIDGPLNLQVEDWRAFSKRSRLKGLHLSNSEMSPNCIAAIVELPFLEKFTIYDVAIDDGHLAPLTTAKNLKEVLIGPNVSGEAILAIREKMPSLKIHRF